MAGVVEVEGENVGGELTGPEGERGVGGEFQGGGDDLTLVSGDYLTLVEGAEGDGVAEGELVEGLQGGDEGLREHNHTGVVDGAQEFLELKQGGDDDKAVVVEPVVGFRGEGVKAVAGEYEQGRGGAACSR